MTLVGDVIMAFREQATDLPQVYGAAQLSSISQTTVTGGQFTAGQTVYVTVTSLNAWGESTVSGQASVTISGGNNAIQVIAVLFPNATAIRVYYSIGANIPGPVYEQFSVSSTLGINTVTVTIINQGVNGLAPSRSTAYNPDTDGPAIGAFAAYRWLNQGLNWATTKNKGGFPSFSAAPSVNAQPLYIMPGYWKKIDSSWYDGYPMYSGRKNDVFRKGLVPGTSAALIIHEASDRLIVELWPQPGRTSQQTTLTAGISASATTFTVASTSNWVLPFGKAQIDNEIVEYAAFNGGTNVFTGVTRGLAGTAAVAHNIGASVTENNIEISGMRNAAPSYSVGASLSNLQLPPGWENALARYMLYNFRSAEQDDAAASRFLKEATDMLGDLSANRIIAGPRQVSISAGRGAETYPGLGGVFGGVIVP